MEIEIKNNKDLFIDLYKEHIKREGSDSFLNWLCETDFFTAPASTKYHNAFEGGLLSHSLSVYKTLRENFFDDFGDTEKEEESFAICGLLHDVCKANFYKTSFRNVKNEATGIWEKVPFYTIEDQFPYGHGEKSVFLIERFMSLKPEEAMAIRWHMGGFDEAVRGGSYSMTTAFQNYPLAVKLHLADMMSTYLKEGR